MNLLDSLKDIVKHTASLGFIEMVKIVGSSTDAKVETIDGDKTVVISGSMYQPIEGIDATVGLSRIAVLKGCMDFPGLDAQKVSIVTENRGGIVTPTEVKFSHNSSYRFMSEAMINEQVKVPPFKGATWDITISPETKKISELAYWAGVLGGFEKRFIAVSDKGNLNFQIGTGPTDRANVVFAENISGVLKHQWSWPLSQVLSILKLADSSKTVSMKFSDMGALMIEIDSGIGKYIYILPAGKA